MKLPNDNAGLHCSPHVHDASYLWKEGKISTEIGVLASGAISDWRYHATSLDKECPCVKEYETRFLQKLPDLKFYF